MHVFLVINFPLSVKWGVLAYDELLTKLQIKTYYGVELI